MKKEHFKTWIFYLIMLLVFGAFTYFLFHQAKLSNFTSENTAGLSTSKIANFELFKHSFFVNIAEPAALLLLQIISILLVSRIFGFLFSKIGQPTVIGEILAGIVLGPSLVGYFFPETFHFLFASKSLGNLYILSQIGLILFMFTIGMELNISELKQKMGKIYVISHASIIIPYFCGMLLSFFVYKEFALGKTSFLSFALFIGISMSITAFPVLARIVQEKGLTKTQLGMLSIASAAINDVTAWCVLAAVIAIAKTGSFLSSLYTIGFSVLYVVLMFAVVKPFLKKIGEIYCNREVINKSIIAFLILILIISSWITQIIGIHALFGAFLAGVVMPQIPTFRKVIVEKIEDVSVTLFLPLFFVFTGLRTEIGLLNTSYLWYICLIFILVAIFGKFIGGAFTARILGESWKDSLSLGILMNTRGLMELIVLNIGYEMGILPPPIFVMLVIMALVTTFMTTPVLSLINFLFPNKEPAESQLSQQIDVGYRVLIALGNPDSGKSFVQVVKAILEGTRNSLSVSVLHITPGTFANPTQEENFPTESFSKAQEEADLVQMPIETVYKITENIEAGIVKYANKHGFDFMLVGAGVSLSGIPFFKERKILKHSEWFNRIFNRIYREQAFFYPGSLIKDKTRYFIENTNCSVGVFINRGFTSVSNTLILIQNEVDTFLLDYALRIFENNKSIIVTVLDFSKLINANDQFRQKYDAMKEHHPGSVKYMRTNKLTPYLFSKYSFMLISYQSWEEISVSDKKLLNGIPSTVIIKK